MRNLRTEEEIIASWKGDIDKPVVSVVCITFNHEPYIEDALEGFLIQETDFPFEILIHDDASTDSTADIIREYEARYPRLIKPIYQVENQYSQGVKISPIFNFPRAMGEYIAMCEGDDYWSDEKKLKNQFEYMRENIDCSLCFHASKAIFADNSGNKSYIRKPKVIPLESKFSIIDAILGDGGFVPTNTMFFSKKYVENIPDWYIKAPVGDLPLMLLLAINGRLGYIDRVMSVYRILVPGSWTVTSLNDISKRRKTIAGKLLLWQEFDVYTGKKYSKFVSKVKNKNRVDFMKIHLFHIYKVLFSK